MNAWLWLLISVAVTFGVALAVVSVLPRGWVWFEGKLAAWDQKRERRRRR